MTGIPLIPMIKVLRQYAAANSLPFDGRRWESIKRTFNHYQIHVIYKN